MVTIEADLWPADIADVQLTPPVSILKSQARLLTEKTKGLIEAVVETESSAQTFVHRLTLIAPALDRYKYVLLRIIHVVAFYPLRMFLEAENGREVAVQSEQELIDELKRYFASEEVKKVIGSLLSQSQ